MNWLRMAAYGAALALLLALGLAVRAHWVHVGERRVQAQWDKAKAEDAEATLQAEQQRSRDLMKKVRNNERIADEDARREAERQRRDAAARTELVRLQRIVETLRQRQLPEPGDTAGIAALAGQADTARQLLGSCSGRYTELAATADGLRDQVTGLQAYVQDVCRTPGTNGP